MNRMRTVRLALVLAAVLLVAERVASQVKQFPLQSTDNLVLHNVAAAPATLQGKSGLRLTISDAAKREQGTVE